VRASAYDTGHKDDPMAQDDRDWYREDRKRRDRLTWNEKRGELELDEQPRRWRLFLPPVWLRETFRFLGYLAATLVLAWIVLYLLAPILA
jgi:hypothetical protein